MNIDIDINQDRDTRYIPHNIPKNRQKYLPDIRMLFTLKPFYPPYKDLPEASEDAAEFAQGPPGKL